MFRLYYEGSRVCYLEEGLTNTTDIISNLNEIISSTNNHNESGLKISRDVNYKKLVDEIIRTKYKDDIAILIHKTEDGYIMYYTIHKKGEVNSYIKGKSFSEFESSIKRIGYTTY